jgi:hypothetical protein
LAVSAVDVAHAAGLARAMGVDATNIDRVTVRDFGRRMGALRSGCSKGRGIFIAAVFHEYFAVFPWHSGLDMAARASVGRAMPRC